jgi:hypothetical protein
LASTLKGASANKRTREFSEDLDTADSPRRKKRAERSAAESPRGARSFKVSREVKDKSLKNKKRRVE